MSNDYPNLSEASQQLSQSTAALLTGSEITSADLAKFNTAVTQTKDSLKALEPGPADSANKANAAMNAADSTWQGAKLRAALIKAATPYPDFWLPLNDSLDLEEGFGQVSFTRSTTATYVDKSGVLKTAGVNEPRFEREGVLIEGASTNLETRSNERKAWCPGDGRPEEVELSEGNPFFGAPSCRVKFKGVNGRGKVERQRSFTPVVGDHYTGSMWVRGVEGQTIWVGLNANKGVKNGMNKVTFTGKWQKVSATLLVEDTTGSTMYPHLRGDIAVTATDFEVACVQLEKLPYATSYIPTSGSPVTRSRDVLNLPPGNMPPFTQEGAYSFYLDKADTGTYVYVLHNVRDHNTGTRWSYVTYDEGKQVEFFYGKNTIVLPTAAKSKALITHVFKDNHSLGYIDRVLRADKDAGLVKDAPDSQFTFSYQDDLHALYGHIRDFKIWHRALTDEQIALL